MLTKHAFFFNPRITAELFDEELLLANLDNGIYYTLSGQILAVINKLPFASFEESLNGLENISEEDRIILDDVWKKLQSEEIVKRLDKVPTKEFHFEVPQASLVKSSAFKIFSDMKDLLLLDPVHEVDDHGWIAVENIGK